MPTTKKHANLFDAATSERIQTELQQMASDAQYSTEASYNADGALYENNIMSFVEKHMNYLRQHKNVDPDHYLSNLRLMTRVR